ncbi:MAG TPA: N,N-dimethylformamidase beta subunit family domain-containing protein [Acidimicrobiales bacterium]|nr:N,N-dimethylformamidase beta subunit family domain-containing protein [Acidimicrobiales bacterium]
MDGDRGDRPGERPLTRQEIQASRAPNRRSPEMSRRFFLRRAAVLGGVVAAGAAGYGIYDAAAGGGAGTATGTGTRRPPKRTTTTTTSAAAKPATVDGVSIPVSAAIVAENRKPGTAWWVTTPQNPGDIEGYASQASAVAGDTVTLFVSTKSPQFHVEAYRMGYYGGVGGRLVWQSPEVASGRQATPSVVSPYNMVQCQWEPSLQVQITPDWPPGAYLLKLVGTDSEQQFVPLCVRDDSSRAAVVIQSSVTTWQAYNRWGGYSLYYGNLDGSLSFTHAPGNGNFTHRARIVSFDRPYDHDWASGAADFVGNELPVIFHAEHLGLDVTYWTDLDLHAQPQLLANHRAMVSLGHDEYWSLQMRDGAQAAVANGTNLAFLGANACYRQVRFQQSPVGGNRQQVCYKDAAEDPMYGVDNAVVTGPSWESAPTSWAESELIGSMYQDVAATADMVIADPGSWLLAGTGVTAGQHLPHVVVGEFDRYVPGGPGPTNVDVVAHSVVPNRSGNYSDVTWYTAPGGGGVFASGNASFVGNLVNCPLIPPNVLPEPDPAVSAVLQRMMLNLYSVIAVGPGAEEQPSQGNGEAVYAGTGSIAAPAQNNAA